MSLSKHCPIKDPRILMHELTLDEFLEMKQVYEILSAQEQAFHKDEKAESQK